MSSYPKLIAVVGPTASGKSSLAFALAKKFNGEVVSADSRQVYRGFDIGTAKDIGRAIHLVDIMDANDTMTVSEYQKRAFETIDGIIARGHLPILAGGTGLYVSSVVDGRTFPDVPPHRMYRFFANIVPVSLLYFLYCKIGSNRIDGTNDIDEKNPRRVIRALEVALFSRIQRVHFFRTYEKNAKIDFNEKKSEHKYNVLSVGVNVSQDELYSRINARVTAMVEGGLFDEVKRLLIGGVSPKSPAMSGIGYREVVSFLQGKTTREDTIALIQKNTRAFAKRQMTWFRRENIHWVKNTEEAIKLAEEFIASDDRQ